MVFITKTHRKGTYGKKVTDVNNVTVPLIPGPLVVSVANTHESLDIGLVS